MLKRMLCAFLALLMCAASVMLAVSCADKPSEESSSDTAESTTTDTTPETNGDDDVTLPTGAKITDLVPSDGKKLKIAFIGDSITQGTGTTNQSIESYPGQLQSLMDSSKYKIGNFGRASAYVLPAKSPYNVWASSKPNLSYKDTLQYKDSIAFKADVVVIMIGTNDMRSMASDAARDAFKTSFTDLCKTYMEQETVQKVFVATSIHVVSNFMAKQMSDGDLQAVQREVASELGLEVLDLYSITREYMDAMFHYTSDRLHPNKEMYGVMARVYKACLFGESYSVPQAPKSDSNVVYLKASGSATADGKTPETAVNKLGIAVSLIRDGGTVVICGAYSVNYETHLPENSGLITITSKYNGVDYSAQGAKLGLSKHFALYGDYKFENIKIHYEASMLFACNYNNVSFGDGVSTTSALGNSYPPLICGYVLDSGVSVANVSATGECNIVVNGGKWAYINGGNRRSKGTLPVGSSDTDAVVNITVNGGEFVLASGTNLSSAIGMNSFAGTCNFTVNGGTFSGTLYAVSRLGSNQTSNRGEVTGTVNMVINGGTFSGKIIAVQDNTANVTGKISITVPSALESKLSGFTDITLK